MKDNTKKMEELAERIYADSKLEKYYKEEREQAKEKLFQLIEDDFTHNDHLLPHRQLEIPDSFWEKTKYTEGEFFGSRFPGWKLNNKTVTDSSSSIYELVRDPGYMAYSVEINTDDGPFKVSKEISEYTPSFDWESLRDELPNLFDKLVKRIETFEINEDELDRLIQIEPEVLSQLQRHMKVRQPALKVSSRKIKDGHERNKRSGS